MDVLKKRAKALKKDVVDSFRNVCKDSTPTSSSNPLHQQRYQHQQQLQEYPPPTIYANTQQPGCGPNHGRFVHPGTLMGPAETQLLQQRAAHAVPVDATWQAARAALAASTPLTYSPHALREVHVEWDDGPKIGHKEFVEQDGVMAYQQAVMWLLSNDEHYARNAGNIIDAWASTNRNFHGKNAPLDAGWGVASFARAAELLKHTWPGWPASGVEGRFLAWVNGLIMPCLNHEMLLRLPLANWQSTVAECKAQLAILTDNKQLWDDALAWWCKVFDAYIKPCGECGETQRDLFHSQFGLGGLIQLAEMAWHQGVDLYAHQGSRLFTAMEFHAYITNGGKPKECCYQLKGIGFLPCGWEVGYNHYHGRMGWDMPQTARMLAAHRPEKYVFHWGLGTLTHYGTAEALCSRQPHPA